MQNEKPQTSQLREIIILVLLIVFGGWFWLHHQYALDLVKNVSYKPSEEMVAIAEGAQLTDDGEFIFYASQPSLNSGETFNDACKRREADSPILGCYNGQKIHLFDVTDERLDGIEEVTAAHEMLHAIYERLSDNERDKLDKLLEQAYKQNKNSELDERMSYYERTEPGEASNELHSIMGTEFKNIDSELEDYYEKYFVDRSKLVALHKRVETQFNRLDAKADSLVSSIDNLAGSINSRTSSYNSDISQLNSDIQTFNQRARTQGGFSSQAEFNQARADLQARSSSLEQMRQSIQANITRYNSLVAQLETINSEKASLYKSIDSTLSTTPTV